MTLKTVGFIFGYNLTVMHMQSLAIRVKRVDEETGHKILPRFETKVHLVFRQTPSSCNTPNEVENF